METTRSLCVPIGLDAPFASHNDIHETDTGTNLEDEDGNDTTSGSGSAGSTTDVNEGGEELDNESGEAEGSTNNDVEEGGCSASPSSPTPWALFGLFALLGMRRRFA